MSVMWDEIAKDVMKDINEENNVFSIGKVINITGSMIEVAGLKDVAFFESVSILNKAKGYVSAIYENTVNISLVEQNDTILIGDKVYTLNKKRGGFGYEGETSFFNSYYSIFLYIYK